MTANGAGAGRIARRAAPWIRRALVVVAGGVLLKALVAALEPKLVFFPQQGEDYTPASLGLPYDAVTLGTADGERIAAWQLEPADPVADVVYFHGNGGNLSLWLPVFATLHQLGYRVLAIDYRGYGLSTGSPSEQGVYRDAEAAVQYAVRGRPSDRPLVYWGRSLGAPIAAHAARVAEPDGLVLESGFPDKAAVIRRQPLLRALNVLSSYRFPTVDRLAGFERPILVIHGERDRIVPAALGRELFERLDGPKQWLAVAGADHNDFFDASRTDYWGPIARFVAGLAG